MRLTPDPMPLRFVETGMAMLRPRRVDLVERVDTVGSRLTLSCGHTVLVSVPSVVGQRLQCAKCVNNFVHTYGKYYDAKD